METRQDLFKERVSKPPKIYNEKSVIEFRAHLQYDFLLAN